MTRKWKCPECGATSEWFEPGGKTGVYHIHKTYPRGPMNGWTAKYRQMYEIDEFDEYVEEVRYEAGSGDEDI